MREPHPRSTDPIYLWPDLVITFDSSGDPVLPTDLRGGTGSGIFCEGDQWDQADLDDDGPLRRVWDDGLVR